MKYQIALIQPVEVKTMAKRTTSAIVLSARRSARRRSGTHSISAFVETIRRVDPKMEKERGNKTRIVGEVRLRGSIATEKAPRVARLVEEEYYYRLLIGNKSKMSFGGWPSRHLTICKEELPALKELFAAL
ncbi:hypothetical protein LCGC14_0101880 [marine sediment metagenome]|uniref:Uncharacterized protein n=1 Tax=marine sediment metagenome TaxID=412755 RepID=A0A0F9YE40_9ZZZZ